MKDLLGKTITNPNLGDEVTFIHTATETNGEKTVLDIKLAPGGGNGLHFHLAFDEIFEVLEGELMVQNGSKKVLLKKGEEAIARKGDVHRFYSKSTKPTRFLVTLNPGNIGFENSLAIGYGLARDGLTRGKGIPANFIHLSILAQISDTHGPGIWKIFSKLFAWQARKPKSQKIQQELIERYCS